MKLQLYWSCFLFCGTLQAQGFIFSPRIPSDSEVLTPLTRQIESSPRLPNTLTLMTWNIHKASEKEAWARDLKLLASDTQVVLLQEAMKNDFVRMSLMKLDHFSFDMAQSFFTDDTESTGVATGADAQLSGLGYFRSPGREPITDTPKMTLMSVFKMEDGVQLLVLNIHGINFVTQSNFENQLEALRPVLLDFQGRIVFAGDFNTWSSGRLKYLLQFAREVGLQQVKFKIDSRRILFDHIFLKGCSVIRAKIYSEIESSDHPPLKATVKCGATSL